MQLFFRFRTLGRGHKTGFSPRSPLTILVAQSFGFITISFLCDMHLDIIYQDEYIVAINKPHGLLVHRSSIAADVNVFAMQLLRDQLQKKVYLIHRLDRKTSGLLLFALDPDTARKMNEIFRDRKVTKTYRAIVRGWLEPLDTTVDYDLKNDVGKVQQATTHFRVLEHMEVPVPYGRYETSRYSLVECYPETGRQHQIRKHLNHLRHPIIGDRPHGCNKQNRLWKERWGMDKMMLHAYKLEFIHPVSNVKLSLEAPLSSTFNKVLEILTVEK